MLTICFLLRILIFAFCCLNIRAFPDGVGVRGLFCPPTPLINIALPCRFSENNQGQGERLERSTEALTYLRDSGTRTNLGREVGFENWKECTTFS